MKRLHVHLAVADLDRSVAFYSVLFGDAPSVLKDDYAKWMLDDPRVNFAVSARGRKPGVSHLGVQVDDAEELSAVAGAMRQTGGDVVTQDEAACCYAVSDKAWISDPEGVAWEMFHTSGESEVFGEDVLSGHEAAAAKGRA